MLGDFSLLSLLRHKGTNKCSNLKVTLGLQSALQRKAASLILLTYRATEAKEATGVM